MQGKKSSKRLKRISKQLENRSKRKSRVSSSPAESGGGFKTHPDSTRMTILAQPKSLEEGFSVDKVQLKALLGLRSDFEVLKREFNLESSKLLQKPDFLLAEHEVLFALLSMEHSLMEVTAKMASCYARECTRLLRENASLKFVLHKHHLDTTEENQS
jgi:hypothetical protein